MSILVVTGTDTGVGKTVVTAALAALAVDRGSDVAVVKPAQTGVSADEPGDLAEIRRLTGVADLHEYARYPGPLSPAAAARHSGLPEISMAGVAARIQGLSEGDARRLVLVEGAGGLLVRFNDDGETVADLARMLSAPVLVVCRAGLGTLNHTALTLEALAHRGLQPAGVVIGAWPSCPAMADRSNIADLEMLAARPLSGVLPAGSGTRSRTEFVTVAQAGLEPPLGGRFDVSRFRTSLKV